MNDFLKSEGYTVPVMMDNKREVHRLYGVRSIPTLLVIDRSGVIRADYAGSRSEAELMGALRSAGLE